MTIEGSIRPEGLRTEVVEWRKGNQTKPNPFTILILSNPSLERPLHSGKFVIDPVMQDQKAFTAIADYTNKNLFGEIPGQAEKLLADSPHASKVRILSAFVEGFLPANSTALVAEDRIDESNMIVPRRDAAPSLLTYLEFDPDIVFFVSKSPTHDRASAWGTTDDDSRGGVSFKYDSRTLTHRFFHSILGMAALHTTATALTPVHEFGHAFSSYTNGFVNDLYVDGGPAFNRKLGHPIPQAFVNYDNTIYASDRSRDGLGYPATWRSYHSELADSRNPALMDNYWKASGGYLASRHDKLTKAYIRDRLAAKVSR